ncbi:MAG: 23S rRNA (uracil(1939)-C(5))-methyltransferase RlmD, partial [Chlamydiota bacterium]|nr:23S rRNA (uracil(1939)-C(5))-methyltransferase RlmD [Chlamydiota bacterium]
NIKEKRRSFFRATIKQIIEKSPYRTIPPCPYFYECGSCQWQHMDYPYQLKAKKRILAQQIEEISIKPQISDTLATEDIYHYRNKAQFQITRHKGNNVSGFYHPRSHRIVPVEDCYVQPELSNQITSTILKLMDKYQIAAYLEKTHQGFLKNIFIRQAYDKNEVIVVFVTTTDDTSKTSLLATELLEKFPSISGIIQNINALPTNVILGSSDKLLSGRTYIHEQIGHLQLQIHYRSFFQINSLQAENICQTVRQFIEPSNSDTIVDLYCGVGLIGLYLAKDVKKIIGIENNPIALDDARANAKLNHIQNAQFICSSSKESLDQLPSQSIDALIVDPPRSGLEEDEITKICTLTPKKIIYVSCHPQSLVRDLEIFINSGYHPEIIQPIDLFPQTSHIESITKLIPTNLKT